MAEHPLQGMMGITMDKVREMVDSSTIIGDPIKVDADTTIIPVSRVTFGFASGGSDVGAKASKDMFGGGSGAGVSITPVAFLIVTPSRRAHDAADRARLHDRQCNQRAAGTGGQAGRHARPQQAQPGDRDRGRQGGFRRRRKS